MLHILPVIEIPTRKLNSSGNGKLSQARAINRKKKEKKQGRRSTVRAPSRRAKGASCKPQERERERERGKRGRESSADSRPIINKKESFREQGPGMSSLSLSSFSFRYKASVLSRISHLQDRFPSTRRGAQLEPSASARPAARCDRSRLLSRDDHQAFVIANDER